MRKRRNFILRLKKIFTLFLVITLLAPLLVSYQPLLTSAEEINYDIAVIFVEKSLWNETEIDDESTLSGKIYRYTKDIQNDLENTKALILAVDSTESTQKIFAVLEKLYLEGEKTMEGVNKLNGVILIGDVPLPTIKTDSVNFSSVFPYTDFIAPAYIYNQTEGLFVDNNNNEEAEIWHGVIRPKGTVDEKKQQISDFLDKNHAFRTSTSSDKYNDEVFYSNFIDEAKNLNPQKLADYEQLSAHRSDFAFLRFNSNLLTTVMSDTYSQIYGSVGIDDDKDGLTDEDELDGIDNDGDGLIDEDEGDGFSGVDNDGDGLIDEDPQDEVDNDSDGLIDEDLDSSPLLSENYDIGSYPDFTTKEKIEETWSEYIFAVDSFVSNSLEDVDNSGRWTEENGDVLPYLITQNDRFVQEYFRQINLAFEDKITAFAHQIQTPKTYTTTVNYECCKNSIFDPLGMDSSCEHKYDFIEYYYLNGTAMKDITSAEQCSLVRGSAPTVENPNSKQVEFNRLYDMSSIANGGCPQYGSCCINNYTNQSACNPDVAVAPVFDYFGTIEVNQNDHSYKDCDTGNYLAPTSLYAYTIGTDCTITGTETKAINTVVVHNEPRPETLKAEFATPYGIVENIPSDTERYVSFQNNHDDLTKFTFPDIFTILEENEKTPSFEDINSQAKEKLNSKEEEINRKILEDNLITFYNYIEAKTIVDSNATITCLFKGDDDSDSEFDILNIGGIVDITKYGRINYQILPWRTIDDFNYYYDFKSPNIKFEEFFNEATAYLKTSYPEAKNNTEAWEMHLRNPKTNDTNQLDQILSNKFSNYNGVDFTNFYLQNGASVSVNFPDITEPTTTNTSEEDDSYDYDLYDYNDNYCVPITPFVVNFSVSKLPVEGFLIDEYESMDEEFLTKMLRWHNLNIDEKHEAIMEGFPVINEEYPGKEDSPYALAFIIAKGSDQYLSWQGEDSIVEDSTDSEWNALLAQVASEETTYEDSVFASDLDTKCGAIDGVVIWEWPSAIVCWLNDIGEKGVVSVTSNACGTSNRDYWNGFDLDEEYDNLTDIYSDEDTQSASCADGNCQIEITPENNIVPIGVDSHFYLSIVDENSEIVQDVFELTVSANNGGTILNEDANEDLEGTQIIAFNGEATIDVQINSAGNIEVNAEEDSIGNKTVSVESRDDLSLKISATSLNEDYEGMVGRTYKIEVQNGDGNKIDNYFGDTEIAVSDPTVALVTPQNAILNDNAEIAGAVNNGESVVLTATSQGLKSASITMAGDASGDPYSMAFIDSPSSMGLSEKKEFYIRFFDINDNIVPLSSANLPQITVGITSGSTAENSEINIDQNGKITVNSGRYTGYIRVYATADGFAPALQEIQVEARTYKDELNEKKPNAIFSSLFGADISNLTNKENTIADEFLWTGNGEAVFAQTMPDDLPYARAKISPIGNIDLIDDSLKIIPITESDKPLRLKIFDTGTGESLSEFSMYFDQEPALSATESNSFTYGISFDNFDQSGVLTANIESNELKIYFEGEPILTVNKDSEFTILDNKFSLEFADNFQLKLIYDNDTEVGNFYFKGAELRVLNIDEGVIIKDYTVTNPGYIIKNDNTANYQFVSLSSDFAWDAEEKFSFLIASGMHFGSTVKEIATSSMMVLGDPTLSLKKPAAELAGFNKTVGEEIFADDNFYISDMNVIDFNQDGQQDILLISEDGEQKIIDGVNLREKGDIIAYPASFNYTNIVDDDIISGTDDNVLIFNNNQEVITKNELNMGPFITTVNADFDQDGFIDLVAYQADNKLVIYWGTENGFEETSQVLQDFSVSLSDSNTASKILINFDGADALATNSNSITLTLKEETDLDEEASLANYLEEENQSSEAASEQMATILTLQSQYNLELDTSSISNSEDKIFLPISLANDFIDGAERTLIDDNGGNLENNDVITTTIKIKNSSNKTQVIALADEVSAGMTLNADSATCENCGDDYFINEPEYGLNYLRFGNISLTSGATATISYQSIYSNELNPNLTAMNLSDANHALDEQTDLFINFTNTSLPTLNLFNLGNRNFEIAQADTETTELPNYLNPDYYEDSDNNGVPDVFEVDTNNNGILDYAESVLSDNTTDSDNDGIPDVWDNYSNTNANASGAITLTLPASVQNWLGNNNMQLSTVITALKKGLNCTSSGCLPIPVNYAFLVAGDIGACMPNGLAATVGFSVTAVPVIGMSLQPSSMGCIPKICSGSTCFPPPFGSACSGIFRFYVSPTLTGALGYAFCTGPGLGTGMCVISSSGIPGTSSICDSINNAISSIGSSAKGITQSVSGKSVFNVDGYEGTATTVKESNADYKLSFDLGTFSFDLENISNRRILGVPAFFDNWLTAQWYEVKAMLTMPILTVYTPDIEKLFTPKEMSVPNKKETNSNNNQDSLIDFFTKKQTEAEADLAQAKASNASAETIKKLEQKVASYKSKKDFLKNIKNKVTESDLFTKLDSFWKLLNNLPIIEIKRPVIEIKIPYLTMREVRAISADMDLWLQDLQKECDRVDWLDQNCNVSFQCADGVPQAECDAQREIAEKVSVDLSALKQSIETNKKILKSYFNLTKILAGWDKQMAEYIDGIICYLDTITDIIGGWFYRNKIRFEKWVELFYTMQAIFNNIQKIFDIIKDFNMKCDVCKASQCSMNFNAWQILFSLIPTPPVIKFPRLPDITLDLSKIKVKLSVEIPKLKLLPQRIKFPKIPRLTLPDVPNINITLPGIPILPELPELPKLPPLPGIPKIELPDLPPPPKLPDIFSNLSSILKTIDKLLWIYCIVVKRGAFVYPEAKVKNYIEAITLRGKNLMPFDFFRLDIPDIEIPGYKEIQVTVKVNLQLKFDQIVETVKEMVKPWNKTVTDLRSETQKQVNSFMNDLRDIWDKYLEKIELDDYEYDVGEETGIDDKLDEVQDSLDNNFESTKADLEQMDTEALLIAMKEEAKKLDQLINKEWKMKDVSEIRESMGLPKVNIPQEKPNSIVKLENLQKNLAMEQNLLEKEAENLIASNNAEIAFAKNSDYVLAAETTEQEFNTSDEITPLSDLLGDHTLLADNSDLTSSSDSSTEESSEDCATCTLSSSQASDTVYRQGVFITNDNTQSAEKLIDYSDEAGDIQKMIFVDIDQDSDDDLIYALPNNVYLKENFENYSPKNTFPYDPEIGVFEDLIPYREAVKNFTATSYAEEVAFKWSTAIEDTQLATQISIRNTVSGFDNNSSTEDREILLIREDLIPENITQKTWLSDLGSIPIGNHTITADKFYIVPLTKQAVTVPFEEGYYHARTRQLFVDEASTYSEQKLLAPLKENDEEAPYYAGTSTFNVPILSEKTISLNGIYDSASTVNVSWSNDQEGEEITVGPYDNPGEYPLIAYLEDAGGNTTELPIVINVYNPDISLDSNILNAIAQGEITPTTENMPLAIIRKRWGDYQLIKTPSADENGRYFSDELSSYLVSDFNLSKDAIIKDTDGDIIATISATNGRILFQKQGYYLQAIPADNSKPSRIAVFSSADNQLIANVYFVSDDNTDVIIDNQEMTQEKAEKAAGVYVFDRDNNDNYLAGAIPADAISFSGGVALYDNVSKEILAGISPKGTILFTQNNLGLRLKESSNILDPVIFEITKDDKAIFDVYVHSDFENIIINQDTYYPNSTSDDTETISKVFKISNYQRVFAANNNQAVSATELPFSDINKDHPYYSAILELYNRNILQGYIDGTFRPDSTLSRAEFVKIALGATTCLDCTTPTDSELTRYPEKNPFPDVHEADWFHFCVVKAKSLEMIMGYQNGYFEPNWTISRAEAVAILLRQAGVELETESNQLIVDVPDYAWYKDYITTGVNMGLITSNYGFVYPDEKITRGEFAMMAKKILDIQDCQVQDTDNDGMPDYWEIQNGLNENLDDSAGDLDNDGLNNLDEFNNNGNPNNNDDDNDGMPSQWEKDNNLNPYDASDANEDTDHGGVINIDEYHNNTNPNDPTDDYGNQNDNDDDNDNNQDQDKDGDCPDLLDGICPDFGDDPVENDDSGTYLTHGDIDWCGSLDYMADLHQGDEVFSAIISNDNQTIFSKSQTYVLEEALN